MATRNLIPRGSGEGGLGIETRPWGTAFFDSGNFTSGITVGGNPVPTGFDIGGGGGAVIEGDDDNINFGGTDPADARDINFMQGGENVMIINEEGNVNIENNMNVSGTISGVTGIFDDRVGIGTTDPNGDLHVNDGDSASQIYITSKDTSTAGLYLGDQTRGFRGGVLYNNSTDSLGLWGYDATTLTAQRMTIDSDGNVGIGTTNPDQKLTIRQSITDTREILFPLVLKSEEDVGTNRNLTTSDGVGIKFMLADNNASASVAGGSFIGAGIAAMRSETGDESSATDLTFLVSQNDETLDEAMRIDSDGNVGIGTTDPNAPLTVKGESLGSNINDVTSLAQIQGSRHKLLFKEERHEAASAANWDGVTYKLQKKVDSVEMQSINFVHDSGALSSSNHIDLYVGGHTSADPVFSTRFAGNGHVGIGTTSPDAKLVIQEDSVVNTLTEAVSFLGGNYTSASNAESFKFFHKTSTANTNRGVAFKSIDGSLQIQTIVTSSNEDEASNISLQPGGGNVGIGTTNPNHTLMLQKDVHGEWEALRLFNYHSDGSTQGSVAINMDVRASNGQIARASIKSRESSDDAPYSELGFFTSNTSSTAPSERMTIDKNGNVGIGTTSPDRIKALFSNSSTLSIGGTKPAEIELGSNCSAYSNFITGTGGLAFMNYSNSGSPTAMDKNSIFVGGIYCQTVSDSLSSNPNGNAGGILRFFTKPIDGAPVERMRIDDHGNVAIGTTDPGTNKLYVDGNIYASGTITPSSDDRVKHNEQPIVGALETLSKITPKKYIKTTKMYEANHDFELDADGNPVDENGEPVEHRIEAGVIAQQVLTVDELAFAVSPEGVNEDGTVTSPHGLDYNSLFTYAIAAIQEQQTIIKDLKSRIVALEGGSPEPDKAEEPAVEEVSEEPAVKEVSEEPAVKEVSEEPAVKEVSEESNETVSLGTNSSISSTNLDEIKDLRAEETVSLGANVSLGASVSSTNLDEIKDLRAEETNE